MRGGAIMRQLLRLAALLVFSVAAAAGTDRSNNAWWSHIKVLASDEMQGRLTGSPGYRKAADYVAGRFQALGLQPAGSEGWFQHVDFEVQSVHVDRFQARLVPRHGGAPTDVTADLVAAPYALLRPDTRAPLVFVGYGLHLPEAGYDDFAGLDLRGAVAVLVIGGPAELTAPQRAHALSENLPHALEAAGAVGVITMTAPKNREIPWERQKAAGEQPGMLLTELALRRYHQPMFVASFNEARADALFARSGHAFGDLVALAEKHQALPRFPLALRIEAHVETELSKVSADNLIGELPGSDPQLAREAVVLSAHLDHLGTGKPDHGDGIFHGAMDDASGVATLLEIARALRESKVQPRRSLLFLAVCGEEKGLLGSRFFAAHPTRHAGHLVADLNTDMFLPLYPLRHLVAWGADESSLGADLRVLLDGSGVELVPDPIPDHVIFVRADQYSFVRRGTPALMLGMMPTPGTDEATVHREWLRTRYHAQADDLDQPVDLAAADAFNDLMRRLAVRIANAPVRPSWLPDSFFARFAREPLP